MKKEELNSQTLYVVRDQQGKLYIAAKVGRLALDFFFKLKEKMDAGE